jgi:hypothetical protein
MTCWRHLPGVCTSEQNYQGALQQKGGEIMKLLTKALERRFAQVGSQRDEKDPLIIAKYASQGDRMMLYASEYNPIGRVFFGYVSIVGDYDEWRELPLDHLIHWAGFGMKRVLNFKEQRASQALKYHKKRVR